LLSDGQTKEITRRSVECKSFKNKKCEDYSKLLQKKMLIEATQVVQISRNQDQVKRLMFKDKRPSEAINV